MTRRLLLALLASVVSSVAAAQPSSLQAVVEAVWPIEARGRVD